MCTFVCKSVRIRNAMRNTKMTNNVHMFKRSKRSWIDMKHDTARYNTCWNTHNITTYPNTLLKRIVAHLSKLCMVGSCLVCVQQTYPMKAIMGLWPVRPICPSRPRYGPMWPHEDPHGSMSPCGIMIAFQAAPHIICSFEFTLGQKSMSSKFWKPVVKANTLICAIAYTMFKMSSGARKRVELRHVFGFVRVV
jgi:hypothetical protein